MSAPVVAGDRHWSLLPRAGKFAPSFKPQAGDPWHFGRTRLPEPPRNLLRRLPRTSFAQPERAAPAAASNVSSLNPTPAAPRTSRERPEMKESVIASDLTIEGKIVGSGHVRIAGRFKGDVQVDGNLTIDHGATLDGQVRAQTVIVGGELKGNIENAKRVELQEGGVITGRREGRLPDGRCGFCACAARSSSAGKRSGKKSSIETKGFGTATRAPSARSRRARRARVLTARQSSSRARERLPRLSAPPAFRQRCRKPGGGTQCAASRRANQASA